MNRLAVLLLPAALLLAAAEAPTVPGVPSVPDSPNTDAHVNRHVDAHVPAREGDAPSAPEPQRTRPAPDPFRGVVRPFPTPMPSAAQPPKDRRY
jgi:hypothetical protein